MAVFSVGMDVEHALRENEAKPKRRRQQPEAILRRVLGWEPGSGPQYGSLASRSDVKAVKVKTGETPVQTLLRLSKEQKSSKVAAKKKKGKGENG